MTSPTAQSTYQVRFDWGMPGAEAIASDVDVIVVLDVLSFTTTAGVAAELGVEVIPSSVEDATAVASRADAAIAAPRGADGLTLSPASFTSEAVAGVERLVLSSPNGSALSAALAGHPAKIVAASFRNRTAVAEWVLARQTEKADRFRVAVIAAGERWGDGTTRFAVEDFLAAGAVIDALTALGIDHTSPEAAAAGSAFTGLRNAIVHLVGASGSARELKDAGYAADVALATQVDASTVVPVLGEWGFRTER